MDERFLKEDGLEVFTGNELVVKGALESRCALITGYPGSPVSDVFDVACANRELLKKHGVLAEMANNEALAVARLNGSRMAGVRAMAVMKSVGLHVAADGLALGNLSEPNNKGGSIVVVGDDPWIDSTQINNDSRYLSQHLHMPVLEPATFQELKDWVGVAFELSSAANLYLTYLITTHQADGGGTVWAHPNRYPEVNTQNPVPIDTERINLDTMVLLPPRTWTRESTLPQRYDRLLAEVRARELNRQLGPADSTAPFGFIASGLPYCYLEHALAEFGMTGRVPLLKLGLTFPVDPQAILELAARVPSIVVVEEKRGFLEGQVIRILHQARQKGVFARPVAVWGKEFPKGLAGIPEGRGLNASLIMQRLLPLFLQEWPDLSERERRQLMAEQASLEATARAEVSLPARTPTFCPGCPHRDSSSILLQIKRDFADPAYMRRVHRRDPVDLLFHGETGCFTMLMFEPNRRLMHNYSGMGLGGGTGAGADPFITNKQVVFLGDSTFFHSGMIAISDSIKNNQDIAYVILDNKTTAMTGHQPTPGTETNLMGERTFAQNIEAIVRAMGGHGTIPVQRVNPEHWESYRALLEEAILADGVKIIIADKECGITYHRRQRKEMKSVRRRLGYLPEERCVNVTPEVCEFCLECTTITGCPGLTLEETPYGPKIVTDLSHCVSDGACVKVKVCPSFEEVVVTRQAPPRAAPSLPSADDLAPPPPVSWKDRWYAYTAGVGGMGAGVVSSVLVQAAHFDGLRVLFSDKKGLAIRNGGVYGHLVVSRAGGVLSPLVPYGKADLILGIDLLETARGLDPKTNLRVAHPERAAAVVNTALNPTVLMLMGRDKPASHAWEKVVRSGVRSDQYWGADLSAISEFYFGSQLYVNMLLLGVAFQRGHLPFSLGAMEHAVAHSVPAEECPVNLSAFRAGRVLAVRPEAFQIPQGSRGFSALFEEKKRSLRQAYGRKTAEAYRYLVGEAVLQLPIEESAHRDLALRVYDLICYENLAFAKRYVDLVLATARKDRHQWNYQATRAVLHNAFHVMAIKDEMYVAHLLTSPEKRARDRARYRIDENNGDRLRYRHFNRPALTIFGKTLRWDMVTRDWQLRLVKRMKFLRRWLPGWHREERDFREWYLELASKFEAEDGASYALWIDILRCPEEVRGYREVRQPKMRDAFRKAEQGLTELSSRAKPAGAITPGAVKQKERRH
jgi:indolepyruvate ferredoxin oxidoreductase